MRLAKYVKFREEKFGGVLFETRSEKVFTLNPTATAVVARSRPAATSARSRPGSKDRFADGDGAIEREVLAFIADLRQQGLLETDGAVATDRPPRSRPVPATPPAPAEAEDLAAPLYVAWQITNECNLACLHCIEESGPGKAFATSCRGAGLRRPRRS